MQKKDLLNCIFLIFALLLIFCLNLNAQEQKVEKYYTNGLIAWSEAVVKGDEAKYEEAIENLKKVIQLDPKHVEAYRILGNIYWYKKRKQEAEQMWARAIQLDPKAKEKIEKVKNPPSVLPEITIAKSKEIKPLSEREVEAASYIIDANILLQQAASGDKRKYQEAIKKCEEAIKIAPNYAHSYLTIGMIYSDLGQYDKSDSFLDKAAALDANLQNLVKSLKGTNKTLRGMSSKERQAYEETIKKFSAEITIPEGLLPTKEKELVREGESYLEEGRYDEAIEKFKEASKINPRYALAYFQLGIAYSYKGYYNEANTAWDKAIKLDPELNSKVSDLKKMNQQLQSMTPEEKRSYQKWFKDEKAKELLPAEERERLKKAKKYYNDGLLALGDAELNGIKEKYDEAITNFKKALELKPDYEEAYLGLGDAYYAQKLYPQAVEVYRRLTAQTPQSIAAHLGLKRCYVAQKKFQEAKTECDIILKLDPDNVEAKECLKKLQSKK